MTASNDVAKTAKPGDPTRLERDETVYWFGHPRPAWIVLALSLLLTWFAWYISSNAIEKRLRDRASFEATDISIAIGKRIFDQQQILRAGVGLFAASDEVSREEFFQFVSTLDIEESFPGLQGYGYAEVVKPQDVRDHQIRIRAEGFPDYRIKPDGKRDLYTSIIYLEPFDWRNRRAFGYDMFSEPTRRAAMEQARDTGEAAMTRAVTLVQETDEDIQRGFLIYLPVYRSSHVPGTIEERREQLQGFVYSPFRMNNLMSGVLGRLQANTRLRIYDGATLSADQLLYDNDKNAAPARAGAEEDYRILKTLNFGGRTWTLEITPDFATLGAAINSQPYFIALGGLAIDLLVFYLITSISHQTIRARQIAGDMTVDMRRQGQRTRQVLDTIGEGILTTDSRGIIETINPAGGEIFGLHEATAEGRCLFDLLPGAEEILQCPKGERPVHSGAIRSVELEAIHELGGRVSVAVAAAPLVNSSDDIWTWVIRDITERKKIEKMQGEFIAVVSHELRTPLTALSGSLGILSAAKELPASKVATMIALAHRNAERLTLLVDDILDMEKFRSSQIEYNMQQIDLVTLLAESVEDHHDFASRKNCRLQLDCEPRSALVYGDAHRLKQIMSNLISNAVKFERQGGEVIVSLSLKARGFRIAVSDHGVGIAKRHRRKIFESFYQVDSLERPEQRGTGLGLPIAQEIAGAHGGCIHVASREGEGSTFFFTLPPHEDAAAQDLSEAEFALAG